MPRTRRFSWLPLVAALALPTAISTRVAFGDGEPDAKAAEAERAKKVADLCERFKSKESDVRLAALLEAREVHDPKVTTALAHALSDPDPSVRMASIDALGRRTDDAAKKQAAQAIAARLPRFKGASGMQEELLLTLTALHDLAQPVSLKPLVDGADLDDMMDSKVMDAWMHAIGNIPSTETVESLIDMLARAGRSRQWWRQSVHQALIYATGEKRAGGGDPDVWRAWWRANKATFDVKAQAERRQKERDEAKAREELREKQKRAREEGGMGGGRGGMDGGGMGGGGMDGGMSSDPPPAMD